MLFHWTGQELVFPTFAGSHKVDALRRAPEIAVTIDRPGPPTEVLFVRGRVSLTEVEGIVPEYAQKASFPSTRKRRDATTVLSRAPAPPPRSTDLVRAWSASHCGRAGSARSTSLSGFQAEQPPSSSHEGARPDGDDRSHPRR